MPGDALASTPSGQPGPRKSLPSLSLSLLMGKEERWIQRPENPFHI